MGRREWIVITLFVLAVVGIVIVVATHQPERGETKTTSEAQDELFRRMTADPNKEAEDQTLTVVSRLGGEIVRQSGHAVFKPVIEVSFRDRPVTDADLLSLAGLVNLRKIDLSGTQVTDAGLRALLAFRYLDALNLSRTAVTGTGLSQFTPLTLLTRVVLAGSKATDAGLVGLVGVPKITYLDLSDTAVTNAGIDQLKALPVLAFLSLARSKVTGKAAGQLGNLGLANLDLAGVALTTDEYLLLVSSKPRIDRGAPPPGGPIPVAPQPTVLTLIGVHPSITDEAVKTLAKRSELTLLITTTGTIVDPELENSEDTEDNQSRQSVLDLSGSPITDSGLSALNDLHDYLVLNLTGTKISDAGLAYPADGRLKTLYLDDTGVSDAGLRHLSRFDKLRILGLRRTKVTDAGLKQLAGVKTLRRLYLDGTAITDAGLTELKTLDNLAVLQLSNTAVTDAGLKHLHALASLRVLDLSHTKVTDAGVAELQAQLPMCVVKH